MLGKPRHKIEEMLKSADAIEVDLNEKHREETTIEDGKIEFFQ